MTNATPPSRRLSELSSHEDPHGFAPLFRSVKAAPEEELPRLRWRLRTSLRRPVPRPRWFSRIALTTGMVFLMGGVVGAVVRPHWEGLFTGPAAKTRPPAETSSPSVRKSIPAPKLAELPAVPIEPPPVDDKPLATPIASQRPLRSAGRPALPAPASPPLPEPGPPAAVPAPPTVPAPPALPSPLVVEQALLGDIVRSLRRQRDPRGALAMLDDHARRFPDTVLAPEAAVLRAEALLGLGRNAEALAVLDRVSLASMPNQDERLVLRGELRAAAKRWREAREDFESTLSDLASSELEPTARALKERALWGRASARSHLGDEAGARADLSLYLRSFPAGRFAAQAAALLQGSP